MYAQLLDVVRARGRTVSITVVVGEINRAYCDLVAAIEGAASTGAAQSMV